MIKAVVADLFMSERILIPSCTAVVTTRCVVEGCHMQARVEGVLVGQAIRCVLSAMLILPSQMDPPASKAEKVA